LDVFANLSYQISNAHLILAKLKFKNMTHPEFNLLG
jgi:hypothetical protein